MRLLIAIAAILLVTGESKVPAPMYLNVSPVVQPGPPIAIPGVYGYGQNTFADCNRDTVIIEKVTSLSGDENQPGTLHYILNNKQHGDTLTIIIWNIGGWARSNYEGKLECIYLAGQTAPGDGVGYHRHPLLRVKDDSRDLVVRGITWARDPRYPGTPGNEASTISISDAQNYIFMENTHVWSLEQPIQISPSAATDSVRNGTIYRSLLAQPQYIQPTLMQISMGDNGGSSSRLTMARNLWHSGSYRNPNITGGNNVSLDASDRQARFLGNVRYNTGQQSNMMARAWMVDVIDSYYKSGPSSNDGIGSSRDFSWSVVLPPQGSGNNADTLVELYVERLIGVHNRDTLTTSDDLWFDNVDDGDAEVACHYNYCDTYGGGDPLVDMVPPYPPAAKRDTPLTALPLEFARINPYTLRDEIIEDGKVGAYQHLQCNGELVMRHDSVLAALLQEARDSTGISNANQIDYDFVAARYLYYKAPGTPCADSDGDGLSDEFELACSGTTTGLSPSGDISGDGYKNAEEYVNGTNFGERILEWVDNSSGEDGFDIYRSIRGFPELPPEYLDSVGPNVTTYTDSSSFVGAKYVVRATEGATSSAFSNEAIAECR